MGSRGANPQHHSYESQCFQTQQDNMPTVQQAFTMKNKPNLWKYSVSLRIPLDILKIAHEIFDEFATMPNICTSPKRILGIDNVAEETPTLLEGCVITMDIFGDILCKLVSCATTEELPKGLLQRCLIAADPDGKGEIGFSEFAHWFSRFGFSEDLLLTPDQKELRRIARTYDMPVTDIEYYKKYFDTYDTDKSGFIDEGEFGALLTQLLKIPANLEMPKHRVRAFWIETDTDGSHSIGFEEFLQFYTKYFVNSGGEATCPLQGFYHGVRKCCLNKFHSNPN